MSTAPQTSPHVVNFEAPLPALEKTADALTSGEKSGDGIVFSPMEAISSGARAGNAMFVFLKTLSVMALRGIIAPCEVLLRHHIGERYFNPWVFFSCVGMAIAVFVRGRLDECVVAAGLLAIFIIGERIHGLVCFLRDRRGDYWHSYSEGTSRFRFKAMDAFLSKWHFAFDFSTLILEPAVLLVASIAIRPMGIVSRPIAFTSLYLFYASVALFVYQLYCYQYRRQLMLDEKDAEIIAEARALSRSPAPTPGVMQHKGVAFVAVGGVKAPWKA